MAVLLLLLLLSVHAIFTLSRWLSSLLHLKLLLHLLEAWIVVLGVERISHLSICDVHRGVAAGVSILIVDVVCLQIIPWWLLLLSLESSIDIFNHGCTLTVVAPFVLILIVFIHELYFNRLVLTRLLLLLLLSRGISLVLNEALHEILSIRLHLLQRKALVLHIHLLLLLLLLIEGVLVLLNEGRSYSQIFPVVFQSYSRIVLVASSILASSHHCSIGRQTLTLAAHIGVVHQVVWLWLQL